MAAYEVLLLNTAIPQIQAAQSGDTYVVPRDIAFSTVANLANGTNLLPSLTFSSDTNTGIYREGADALGFTAGGGTNQMVLTSTGLGIGTNSPSTLFHAAGANPILLIQETDQAANAQRWGIQSETSLFKVRAFNDAMSSAVDLLIGDRSGNLGLGVTPSGYLANKFVINTGTDSNNGITIASATNRNGAIWFADGTTGSEAYRGGVDYQHTTDTLYLYSGGLGNFQLSAAGNIGLGVTPSAWSGAGKIIQFGNGNASIGTQNNGDANFLHNAYESPAGTFKYASSNPALRYQLDINNNAHKWYTAPSGFGYGTTATSLTSTQNGNSYTIVTAGTTDFTLIGAADNNVGTTFTKSGGTGAGTGTVSQNISFTQAMTLDASGNLQVGATSANPFRFKAVGTGGNLSGNAYFVGLFGDGSASAKGVGLGYDNSSQTGIVYGETASAASNLAFWTYSGSAWGERARITSGGYFKASNAGTYLSTTGDYHELRSSNDNYLLYAINTRNGGGGPFGISVEYSAQDPNGTGNEFLQCVGISTLRAEIRSNGGLANYQSNNVDLSDARTKTDINPLASYWNKIAALEIVTYKYKDQTHDDLNIGVIAQQVEQVAPEFVDADGFGETPEDGVPLKTIYNKDLTFAAIKALQEAMARIEKLEAEVAALKGA